MWTNKLGHSHSIWACSFFLTLQSRNSSKSEFHCLSTQLLALQYTNNFQAGLPPLFFPIMYFISLAIFLSCFGNDHVNLFLLEHVLAPGRCRFIYNIALIHCSSLYLTIFAPISTFNQAADKVCGWDAIRWVALPWMAMHS